MMEHIQEYHQQADLGLKTDVLYGLNVSGKYGVETYDLFQSKLISSAQVLDNGRHTLQVIISLDGPASGGTTIVNNLIKRIDFEMHEGSPSLSPSVIFDLPYGEPYLSMRPETTLENVENFHGDVLSPQQQQAYVAEIVIAESMKDVFLSYTGNTPGFAALELKISGGIVDGQMHGIAMGLNLLRDALRKEGVFANQTFDLHIVGISGTAALREKGIEDRKTIRKAKNKRRALIKRGVQLFSHEHDDAADYGEENASPKDVRRIMHHESYFLYEVIQKLLHAGRVPEAWEYIITTPDFFNKNAHIKMEFIRDYLLPWIIEEARGDHPLPNTLIAGNDTLSEIQDYRDMDIRRPIKTVINTVYEDVVL